jgi:hypothetical protein
LEDEWELADEDFRALIADPSAVAKRYWSSFGIDLQFAPSGLTKTLTVDNHRTVVPLKTGDAEYSFCYDKFHYFHDREVPIASIFPK